MENEKPDIKAKILQVGESLFAQKGFDGISIDEIAHEANINKSMIYYYFSSKEGLLISIIQRHVEEFEMRIGKFQIADTKNIRDVVNQIITTVVDYMLQNENIIKILHYESLMSRKKLKTDIFNFINPIWNKIETAVRARFPDITDIFILDKLICISLIIDFVLILERLDCETEEDFNHMKTQYINRLTDIIELLLVKNVFTGGA